MRLRPASCCVLVLGDTIDSQKQRIRIRSGSDVHNGIRPIYSHWKTTHTNGDVNLCRLGPACFEVDGRGRLMHIDKSILESTKREWEILASGNRTELVKYLKNKWVFDGSHWHLYKPVPIDPIYWMQPGTRATTNPFVLKLGSDEFWDTLVTTLAGCEAWRILIEETLPNDWSGFWNPTMNDTPTSRFFFESVVGS